MPLGEDNTAFGAGGTMVKAPDGEEVAPDADSMQREIT